jgi:hypothetical protein
MLSPQIPFTLVVLITTYIPRIPEVTSFSVRMTRHEKEKKISTCDSSGPQNEHVHNIYCYLASMLTYNL